MLIVLSCREKNYTRLEKNLAQITEHFFYNCSRSPVPPSISSENLNDTSKSLKLNTLISRKIEETTKTCICKISLHSDLLSFPYSSWSQHKSWRHTFWSLGNVSQPHANFTSQALTLTHSLIPKNWLISLCLDLISHPLICGCKVVTHNTSECLSLTDHHDMIPKPNLWTLHQKTHRERERSRGRGRHLYGFHPFLWLLACTTRTLLLCSLECLVLWAVWRCVWAEVCDIWSN